MTATFFEYMAAAKADLEALKSEENAGAIDKLKHIADQNDDSKLNFDDIKEFDLGDTASEVKDSFFKK